MAKGPSEGVPLGFPLRPAGAAVEVEAERVATTIRAGCRTVRVTRQASAQRRSALSGRSGLAMRRTDRLADVAQPIGLETFEQTLVD
ncbi:MAG: hypothetical protein ACI81R_000922 [Bradymonadia bacterium]|jgi:hypothetical protein